MPIPHVLDELLRQMRPRGGQDVSLGGRGRQVVRVAECVTVQACVLAVVGVGGGACRPPRRSR